MEQSLARLDGVKQVQVDYEKTTATVTMVAGKNLERPRVEEALRPRDYFVRSFEKQAKGGGPAQP